MNQLMEKQDQLLAELKEWKKKEMDRVIQVQNQCEEILVETPSIGALDEEPMPNVGCRLFNVAFELIFLSHRSNSFSTGLLLPNRRTC